MITNEARTRIVRLYADSYKNFLEGFEILQELQENIEVDMLVNTKELAKKEVENPTEIKKKFDTLKRRTLRDEKEFSDEIYNELSDVNGEVARRYRDKYEEIYKLSTSTNNDSVKSEMTNKLRNLNIFAVRSIIEQAKSTDINEEIKRNLVNEIDKYGISKSSTAIPDQNTQLLTVS